MRKEFAVIDAQSILGLRPTGVELLSDALKTAGLMEKLNAEYIGKIIPYTTYSYERDKKTRMLNPESIKYYSLRLAEGVQEVLCRINFLLSLEGIVVF